MGDPVSDVLACRDDALDELRELFPECPPLPGDPHLGRAFFILLPGIFCAALVLSGMSVKKYIHYKCFISCSLL